MDTRAFHKMSYGLYIISTRFENKDYGCIVNTLTQLTSTPAQMSVTVNKKNCTADMINKSGYFTATPLTIDAPMTLIGTFGFKSGLTCNKFEGLELERDANQIAYLTQNTNAVFSLKVSNTVDVGTHNIYIGEVLDAKPLSDGESMTYAYYHTVKGGKTPPKASSYIDPKAQTDVSVKESEVAPKEKVQYVCSVCGYIYDGDPLPDDFICPVCGQPASVFEKVVS